MLSRRRLLRDATAAGLALTLRARSVLAQLPRNLIHRRIPSTGEALPIVGLGSSATFSDVADSDDRAAIRDVLTVLADHGGRVFDTAPVYGASESVAGSVAQQAGLHERLFWATKINVRRQGSTLEAARAQVEASFDHYGKTPIDLIQVHNIPDFAAQLPLLQDLKQAERVRYIGVTTTNSDRYDAIASIMRSAPIDFIGIDYAIDNREAAESVLPLAHELGIGVLIYQPFGRTRLWQRVRGHELPGWATELGVSTWAQFFIKYVAAHPAVTCVTPATSRPENMLDNLGAAVGELPDEATCRRMVEVVEALPSV